MLFRSRRSFTPRLAQHVDLDRRAAAAARRPVAPVDPEPLARAQVAGRGLDGALLVDLEHPLRAPQQPGQVADPGDRRRGVHAAGEAELGHVHVADAREVALVEQGLADLARALLAQPPQRLLGGAQGQRRVARDQLRQVMRAGKPAMIEARILPALRKWAARDPDRLNAYGLSRTERVRILFGEEGRFDDENALDRFQLLYESGLVEEARRDGRASPLIGEVGPLGEPMQNDHRRILATAMGRLRAKIKYRPVIFELMPETFSLTALQRMAEAISGRHLHKQNFRRLVESSAVVEATGEMSHTTGGRPAALRSEEHTSELQSH